MAKEVEVLIRRLRTIGTLGPEEEIVVRDLPLRLATLAKGDEVASDGEVMDQSCLLLAGWMHRLKDLPDGSRQILSFHVPGDIPDLQSFHLKKMDHSLAATSVCEVAFIKHADLRRALLKAPGVADLFWRDTLVDAGGFRIWMTMLGQANAEGRMAHLFCELYVRLRSVDMAKEMRYQFPVTQTELAHALGITPVHVNRTLQELRSRGLLRFEHHEMIIHDWDRLSDLAQFDASYLHYFVDVS